MIGDHLIGTGTVYFKRKKTLHRELMFFLINSWDLKNRTFSDGDVKLSDWTSFSDETFIQLYGWGVLVMGRLVMERFPLKTRNY